MSTGGTEKRPSKKGTVHAIVTIRDSDRDERDDELTARLTAAYPSFTAQKN